VGLVRRVAAALAAPVTLAGAAHSPSARLGVAAAEPGDSPEDVVRHAGLALRHAGGDGGSDRARGAAGEGAGVFDPGLRAAQADLQAAASRLRAALAGEELTLHFQPVVELPAERLHGREALVRWRQPDGRVLPPAAFLDAAVQAGLGAAVDRWVLDRACAAAAGWAPGVGVSVNVSAAQFADPDLVGVVGRAVRQHALDPARLTLEITETALLRRTDWTQATLQELRRLGVRLAVDDFGAGYSSLSYLHHFELDAIKIDRSFVSRLGADRQAEGIVRAILHLAAALELEVVAEGVERDEQLERLLALTPSAPVRLHGQGYLFGRPGPDGGGRLGNLPSEVAGGAAVPRPCRYAERFEQRVV
ncbi:MAG: EAL domain-containing protein, partial [Acidimicrobiales bacterium]